MWREADDLGTLERRYSLAGGQVTVGEVQFCRSLGIGCGHLGTNGPAKLRPSLPLRVGKAVLCSFPKDFSCVLARSTK